VEKDKDLRTKYLKLIEVWKAYSATAPPSDHAEDSDDLD
jgi:hypothetical protein